MRLSAGISIGELQQLARRRLPRVLFEVIESGVEEQCAVVRNAAAFQRYRLLPHVLTDVSKREQTTAIFGRLYAGPFGIAPTGVAALFRRDADLMLAQAAAQSRIPFVMSGSSIASIERIAKVAPENTWYQLYQTRNRSIAQDVVRRADDAGFPTLVVTVDQPVLPRLERDRRNGFGVPLRLRLPMLLEALTHPAWMFEYLRGGGMPIMETWAAYAPANASAREVAMFCRTQTPCVQTWKDLEELRRLWPRHLVVKGILHHDDARMAAELDADGIVVSNHGGKSLDRAPAPHRFPASDCEWSRRQAQRHARRRRAARFGHRRRQMSRRAVRVHRPGSALRGGGRWISRRVPRDRNLAGGNRRHTRVCRLPEHCGAWSEVSGRGRLSSNPGGPATGTRS
jgi:(S)-mandelate dehydrogenase